MVFLEIATDSASQHLLLAVSLVISAYGAGRGSWAFGQLIFGILAHVISIALSFVAGLAEMGVSPAEPLSDAAAKFALELDEVLPVLWTVLYWNVAAIWTNELFGVEGSSCVLGLVHCGYAIFPASEVRLFAFKTHEICINYTRIFLRLSEVRGVFIL